MAPHEVMEQAAEWAEITAYEITMSDHYLTCNILG